jgi:hypothetical protein
MTDVNKTLSDRDKVHGDYSEMAIVARNLKKCVYYGRKYGQEHLTAEAAEAIDMICTKLARILAGDPHHADHWHDIAGYAMLVERHLKDGKND